MQVWAEAASAIAEGQKVSPMYPAFKDAAEGPVKEENMAEYSEQPTGESGSAGSDSQTGAQIRSRLSSLTGPSAASFGSGIHGDSFLSFGDSRGRFAQTA